MPNRLSHTAKNLYEECGQKYKFHYVDKYRPKTVWSALVFGSAFDKAIGALLNNENAEKVFNEEFSKFTLNGVIEDVKTSSNIKFSQKDFDKALLPEAANEYEELLDKKRANSLTEEESAKLQLIYYASLKLKGLMMIEAWREEISPKIKKVLSVQKEIKIENSAEDSIIGFVDLVVEWEDGRTVIFDVKTSRDAYPDDSVVKSEQLSLYCYALENFYNTKTCGFIVFNKDVKKRKDGKKVKPYIQVQVLIDDVITEQQEQTLSRFEVVNVNIANKVFDKNQDSCYNFGKCPFFNLCHNGDETDVVKLAKKD